MTKHDWSAGGTTIHYTATAGNLLVRDEADKPIGSILLHGLHRGWRRPREPGRVTFFYNGGPGSATIWLHMGSLGPIRVITDSPKATGPAPFHWVQNESSLIDRSDLVFYRRTAGPASRGPSAKARRRTSRAWMRTCAAFNKFITRYITVNQRWNSPKIPVRRVVWYDAFGRAGRIA